MTTIPDNTMATFKLHSKGTGTDREISDSCFDPYDIKRERGLERSSPGLMPKKTFGRRYKYHQHY